MTMKPNEYLAKVLVSADDLKRLSTTLKRTAGGVHAVVTAKQFHGLSDKELKILADAQSLLNMLSANMAKASNQKKANEDQFNRRLTQAKNKLAENFGSLESPRELVPMIAMTGAAFWLNHIGPRAAATSTVVHNMQHARKEALNLIAYDAAKSDGDLDAKINQAWEKLQTLKPSLEEKHRGLIVALEEITK